MSSFLSLCFYTIFISFHFKFDQDCSSNGTYLNRNKLGQNEKRVLRDNDIITANGCDLTFQFKSYHVIHNDLPKNVGIEDRYHIGKKIGSGGCGQVYLAFDCETTESYAMKMIYRKLYAENSLTKMTNEATILRKLKHPCIIQLHDIFQAPDTIVIVLEYMEGGDLMQRILESGYLSEDLMKFYFYQICHGIMYMHENDVTHRDLKPDNILLATSDKYTIIKISDFGLSKLVRNDSDLRTLVGTRMFVAPEILQGAKKYTNKVDIWSLGVILFTCLSGSWPFSDNYGSSMVDQIIAGRFKFRGSRWTDVSQEAKMLICELLTVEANKRPNISLVLSHVWLDGENISRAQKCMSESQKNIKEQTIDKENLSNFFPSPKRKCVR